LPRSSRRRARASERVPSALPMCCMEEHDPDRHAPNRVQEFTCFWLISARRSAFHRALSRH
jgi:hypothetical protein